MQAGLADDLLLHERHFLERQLDAEITPRHHDRIGSVQDATEVAEGRVFLDLRDQLGAAGHQGPQLIQILGPADKRQRDIVHAPLDGALNVVQVLLGQRGRTHFDTGEIHALVRPELTAVVHPRAHPVVRYAHHFEGEQPVIEEDPCPDPHVAGEIIVGRGNLTRRGLGLRCESDDLPRNQAQGRRERTDPDAGSL